MVQPVFSFMEQQVEIGVDHDHQWNHIEYVKVLVDDIYRNKLFYSFSLSSLELSRRFMAHYHTCKTQHSLSASNLKQLNLLAEKLEEKLSREGNPVH